MKRMMVFLFVSILSLSLIPVLSINAEEDSSVVNNYENQIIILGENIIQDVEGNFTLNYEQIKNINIEYIQEIEVTLNELNEVRELKLDKSNEVTLFAFGNWYSWGYAYTLDRNDIQQVASGASAIGGVAALAAFVPDVTWSKAVAIAGAALSAIGGVLTFANLSYFTFNFVGGIGGPVSFSWEW